VSLRAKLDSGAPLFGAWAMLGDPVAVEAVSSLGFDWIGIDMQHGLMGQEGMVAMAQAAAIGRTPVVVRVASHDAAAIGRALDAGAEGVIVPAVESGEQAARIVAACRYPPVGVRSWGHTRAALHGAAPTPERANAETLCIPMVETAEGVARVDEIAAVDGVDAIYVGPADLALSMGLPLSALYQAEEHRAMMDRVLAACRARGIAAGAHAPGPGRAAGLAAAGYRFLAAHVDITALRASALRALNDARGAADA
jgi:4-hydroxy-2-oxoheptanedioate aldolase